MPPYGAADFATQNFPRAVQTQVVAVNDLAHSAGFYVDRAGNNVGWVKVNGRFTAVSNPVGPSFNQLLGLNNSGVAAGFYNDAHGRPHGYTYNIATKTFTPITPPGANNSTVTGINDQGMLSGFYTDGGDFTSFLYLNGHFRVFELFGSKNTQAFGVNDTGTVVGSYTDNAGAAHGFVWRNGVAATVDDPNSGGTGTVINGINNGGSLVGFYLSGANTIGFLAVPSISRP